MAPKAVKRVVEKPPGAENGRYQGQTYADRPWSLGFHWFIVVGFAARDKSSRCSNAQIIFLGRDRDRHLGTCGVPDFEKYPTLRLPYSAREYVADLKAWWDVNLGHRRAGVMGAPETSLATISQ